MPRWETKSAKGEKFLELELDGARLWRAEGTRAPGASKWTVGNSDPKRFGFKDEAAAQADFDKQVSKLPKSAVRVGDETPVITPALQQARAEKEKLEASMRAWEAEHGLMAKLKAHGSVRLVGLKASNREEYVEVALEGTVVITRRGTGSARPKTEKTAEDTLERALVSAQLTLMSNMTLGRFGPQQT